MRWAGRARGWIGRHRAGVSPRRRCLADARVCHSSCTAITPAAFVVPLESAQLSTRRVKHARVASGRFERSGHTLWQRHAGRRIATDKRSQSRAPCAVAAGGRPPHAAGPERTASEMLSDAPRQERRNRERRHQQEQPDELERERSTQRKTSADRRDPLSQNSAGLSPTGVALR